MLVPVSISNLTERVKIKTIVSADHGEQWALNKNIKLPDAMNLQTIRSLRARKRAGSDLQHTFVKTTYLQKTSLFVLKPQ